jgi:hypothetical protein
MADPMKRLLLNVYARMTDSGFVNNLCSRTVADVATVVQKSGNRALRPHKLLRDDDVNVQLAMQLVFEYLQHHHSEATLRCIDAETDSRFPTEVSPDVRSQLNISGTNQLATFTGQWVASAKETVEQNRDALARDLLTRISAFPVRRKRRIRPAPGRPRDKSPPPVDREPGEAHRRNQGPAGEGGHGGRRRAGPRHVDSMDGSVDVSKMVLRTVESAATLHTEQTAHYNADDYPLG